MASNVKKLGDFIEQTNERNTNTTIANLLGVSIEKKFIPSIANTIGTDLSNYKVVHPGEFAYGPVTSRNGDKVSIALYEGGEDCIISSSYMPFSIVKEGLLPEYLMLWFSRPEFDRYARFKSHGSAREVFDWEQLCNVELPVPPIENQKRVLAIKQAIERRMASLAKLNDYLAELGDALFAQTLKGHEGEISYHTFESFCDVKGGKRLPKGSELSSEANSHPYIRVRDLNNASILLLTPEMLYVDDETQADISRYIVNSGEVIVSVVGTIGLTAYIGKTLDGANLTENCNKLTSFKGDFSAWSYFFLRSPAGMEAIRLGTVGAVQAKLPLKNIKSMNVPFIPARAMEKASSMLKDILEVMQANLLESLALINLRDTLIPRLMSGVIDVSRIDLIQLKNK